MKISLQTAFNIVLALLLIASVSRCEKESKNSSNKKPTADTVYVDRLPEEVKKEDTKLRSQKPTLKEKLIGVQVLPPSAGEGPVTVYNEKIPTDTAMAQVSINDDKLSVRLQAPADSGMSRWIDLPVKEIGHCQDLAIGGNGTVRCNRPVFGVLDLFADVALGVDRSATIDLNDRVGLEWRRFKNSSLALQLFVRPSDLATGESRLYFGASKSFNLIGN